MKGLPFHLNKTWCQTHSGKLYKFLDYWVIGVDENKFYGEKLRLENDLESDTGTIINIPLSHIKCVSCLTKQMRLCSKPISMKSVDTMTQISRDRS